MNLQDELAEFIGSRYFAGTQLVPSTHLNKLRNNIYQRDNWLSNDEFLTYKPLHDHTELREQLEELGITMKITIK